MDEGNFSVVAEIARRIKQENVAQFGDDPDESLCDLMSFVVGLRQRKQLFMLIHGPGPQSARECVYLAATYLYSCDELFQVADARYKVYTPDLPTEEWEKMTLEEQEAYMYEKGGVAPGQIGEAWERGEREGIQECIVIYRMPFAGPVTSANYNYERTGRSLKWTHVLQTPEGQHHGAIIDFFKGGLRKRKELYPILDKMGRDTLAEMVQDHEFTKDEAQYWIDRGMAKYLSSYKSVFLMHYLGEVKELGLGPALFKDGVEISEEEAMRLRNA
jgi:hypothetical protein